MVSYNILIYNHGCTLGIDIVDISHTSDQVKLFLRYGNRSVLEIKINMKTEIPEASIYSYKFLNVAYNTFPVFVQMPIFILSVLGIRCVLFSYDPGRRFSARRWCILCLPPLCGASRFIFS